jgi:hypothetical protein
MKIKAIIYVIFSLLLTILSNELACSQNHQANQAIALLPSKYTSFPPVLDSSLDVSILGLSARNQLIAKIYEVDQRYRIKLHKAGWTLKNKQTDYCWRMMAINDPVNRTLLLKLLKLDNWPCDKDKGDQSMSFKAWIIAWHGRGNYKEMMKFYPYLLNAQKSGCINNQLFNDFDSMVKHLYKVGYR